VSHASQAAPGVCQAAPGKTGDLLNYCAPATSRRCLIDAVRGTVVKATLLRSQPCAMLPRARLVVLARPNSVFTMGRKANCRAPPAPAGAADRNPAMNRLEPKPTWPQPSPFRGDLAQNAVDKNQGPRVRGAYRGDCG
jgi:hypothetical protein